MTGYHLSIGYNSRLPAKNDAFAVLKAEVARLRELPETILSEVTVEYTERTPFVPFAAAFGVAAGDATITVWEPGQLGPGHDGQIMLLASGGGQDRAYKEVTRRAFCRLVIRCMHQKGIEVNLHVA